VAAAVVLTRWDPQTRDPDSLLYAKIAAQLSTEEPARWIAPRWTAAWYQQGLFRDHPVGIFILPALLARAGYPAEQAAYAVNGVYQVGALLIAPLLAAAFAPGPHAGRLAWLLQLLPVAFVYRIRANHEPALLLLLFVALYATERSREAPAFTALLAAALQGLLLVKGLMVVPAALACAAWLVARGWLERKPTRPAWLGLLAGCALLLVTVAGYEAAYRRVTGESFLEAYTERATRADPNPVSAVSDTLYNLAWYGGRLAWMSAPWGVLAFAGWRLRRNGSDRARAGLLFAVLVTALYVGLFSLGERRAERYIFPVYFVAAAAGALVAMGRFQRLARLLARCDSPYVPVLLWAATFGLTLLGGRLGLPRLKFWNSDV
jgi:hypothetical protein